MAITAVLVSLLLPTAQSMLGRGHSAKCMANMKSIGVAISAYSADNNALFPRGGWGDSGGVWNPPLTPGPTTGWLADIWPYVGESRKVFECPGAQASSPTGQSSWTWLPNATAADPRYPMHYGYNAQLNSNRDVFRSKGYNVDRVPAVQRLSGLPVLIDVVFQNNFYGGLANVFDAKASQSNGTSFATRHNGRGNVLWGDGRVTAHTAEEWAKMPEELVPTGNVFEKRWQFCRGNY